MNIFHGVFDPYFLKYLTVAASILVIAGVILVSLRAAGLKENRIVSHSWKAYCSWLVMALVIFGVLALGRVGFIAGMLVLSVFCIREFSMATGLYSDKWFMSVIYANVTAIYWCVLIGWYGLFIIMPVFGLCFLFMVPVFRNQAAGMLQKVGLSAVAVIYMGWFPGHLAFLANHPHMEAYVLFLLLGVALNDMSAYIIGSMFGRRKLITNVSPNKTTEGTAGAMLVAAVYVWLARPWVPDFTPVLYTLSFLIIWIGGTLGDLIISVIKRDVGVKDMGIFIPGHGGLLDRVDSLLFAAPLFFHMINYFLGFPGMTRALEVVIK
jgi:phosphatidate cytidylyltransferase